MTDNPYRGLPDRQFWKKDPGIERPRLFDPVTAPPFTITRKDKVVTAGSCFAQHLAQRLSEAGFNHLITEPAHPVVQKLVAQAHNYGMFSARYGNVYTARQLKQLLQRAYGQFTPRQSAWALGRTGKFVDPLRPQIQPGGFESIEELEIDRTQQLAATREAIEALDVFVFTLGLTECWVDTRDGTVFPLAPGVAGGEYDPETVGFRNFDEVETYDDLHFALSFIREINPQAKIILTVSPVPLNATMEDAHVFAATTWSKAVLRIAAEKATRNIKNCYYFPSYEIITAPQTRARYFDEDRRSILPQGVDHVMRLFFRHLAKEEIRTGRPSRIRGANQDRGGRKGPAADAHGDKVAKAMELLCDEEMIRND